MWSCCWSPSPIFAFSSEAAEPVQHPEPRGIRVTLLCSSGLGAPHHPLLRGSIPESWAALQHGGQVLQVQLGVWGFRALRETWDVTAPSTTQERVWGVRGGRGTVRPPWVPPTPASAFAGALSLERCSPPLSSKNHWQHLQRRLIKHHSSNALKPIRPLQESPRLSCFFIFFFKYSSILKSLYLSVT